MITSVEHGLSRARRILIVKGSNRFGNFQYLFKKLVKCFVAELCGPAWCCECATSVLNDGICDSSRFLLW